MIPPQSQGVCNLNDTRRAFVASHVGLVRKNNEDACATSGAEGLLTNWRGTLSTRNGWALVADGVGGHAAGDTASALAIEILRPMMPKLQSDRDVQLAVNAADAALFVAMQLRPDLNGMGTTIAGVVLKQDGAIAFNAGDSRVYAFEQGELHQVSTDDTTIGGELLQCLGGYQEPSPMFVHSRWVGAHSTLIICSDGLTAVVSEATIVKTLLRGVDDPAAALVDAAIAAGAPDNVTVAVIMPQRGSS